MEEGANEKELTNLLFSIEQQSEHPLAEAVVRYFKPKAATVPIDHFESITGKGVKVLHAGNTYLLGSPALLLSENIQVTPELQKAADEWLTKAQTVIWLADKENALAAIAIADKIKQTSIDSSKKLTISGHRSVYANRRQHQTAKAIADAGRHRTL